MLPKELDALKRALEGKRTYTFAGDARLCKELEEVDALLERVKEAKSTTEVHDAIDHTASDWHTSHARSDGVISQTL